jgi:hypothetical protein
LIDSSPRAAATPHRRTASHRPSRFHLALLLALASLCAPALLTAQSMPTASRAGDLQLGVGFVFAHSNYNFTPIHLLGGAGYIDFATRPHWGGEFNFHQVKSSSDSTVYQRTYEIGPRIFVHRGRFVPYAKLLYGRGVYNFHNDVANVAYNMVTGGGGIDYALRPAINLRADYEYQTWMGFPITNLHPNLVTLGVAFHY